MSNSVGLLVRLVAKPEKAADVAAFLREGASMAQEEQGTPLWCAIQLDNNNFVIFDRHNDEAGRTAHLQGKIAAKLMANAGDWLAAPPTIENTTFLSSKEHTPAAVG